MGNGSDAMMIARRPRPAIFYTKTCIFILITPWGLSMGNGARCEFSLFLPTCITRILAGNSVASQREWHPQGIPEGRVSYGT